jgi:chitinase
VATPDLTTSTYSYPRCRICDTTLIGKFPTSADTTNYTALVAEFGSQIAALNAKTKKYYLLTIAAPAGSQNYSNIQLTAVAANLDFTNLETYDYHGTMGTNH